MSAPQSTPPAASTTSARSRPIPGSPTTSGAYGLGDVVNALTGAGLRVTSLRESDEIPWPRSADPVPAGNGFWRLPGSAPRIPLVYALAAHSMA